MNAITPALSATLLLQPQQNQAGVKADLKMEDKPSSVATSGGNSTITLSDEARTHSRNATGLATTQTVQQAISPESREIEGNQTTSDLTYASNLQNRASFFSQE